MVGSKRFLIGCGEMEMGTQLLLPLMADDAKAAKPHGCRQAIEAGKKEVQASS